MNKRVVLSFLVVLMVSMTSGLVHELTLHENAACDLCLHIQSHDVADLGDDEVMAVQPSDFTEYKPPLSDSIIQKALIGIMPIRGPPFVC